MATVKINIKDWPGYLARLGDRAKVAVQRGIVSGAHECVQLMQRRTEQAAPASANGAVGAINTGDYRRRWRVAEIAHGARLYNAHPAAAVIDGGRRAGGAMPPLRQIARWAQRRMGLSAEEAARAAYPIARAIARRGLEPRRVMSGAVDEMRTIVVRSANRELMVEFKRGGK